MYVRSSKPQLKQNRKQEFEIQRGLRHIFNTQKLKVMGNLTDKKPNRLYIRKRPRYKTS